MVLRCKLDVLACGVPFIPDYHHISTYRLSDLLRTNRLLLAQGWRE